MRRSIGWKEIKAREKQDITAAVHLCLFRLYGVGASAVSCIYFTRCARRCLKVERYEAVWRGIVGARNALPGKKGKGKKNVAVHTWSNILCMLMALFRTWWLACKRLQMC